MGSVVGNAAYDARRGRVQRLVLLHETTIASEIDGGGGARLTEAMVAARVPDAVRPVLLNELRSRSYIYRDGDGLRVEPVTVALMVHGR